MRTRLGSVLSAAGIISEEGLQAISKRVDLAGEEFDLVQLIGDLDRPLQERIARGLAGHLGTPYVEIDSSSIDPALAPLVPRSLARKHHLVPLKRTPEGVVVAMVDPTNVVALDDVRARPGMGRVISVVATASAVDKAQRRLYAVDMAAGDLLARLGVDPEAVPEMEALPGNFDDENALQEASRVGPVVVLVDAILADAIRNRATDIHVEPRARDLRIRQRVDGLLRESMTVPKHLQALVISRLKIIADMDISERRKAQDGRAKVRVDDKTVDARLSTIPAHYGEKVVVRLLHREESSVSLASLGLEAEQLSVIKETLDNPQGLVVFTGPTGAGKSSTMYAALSHVSGPELNSVSLEDPVEYQMEGVNQVQIDERGGITFAEGLRSILRQDPDVVMVGEVRDSETAQMVVRAAATGHLVLSSLHTNDSASVISRLVGLGLETSRVTAALSVVVAQRLVRVICDSCKVEAEADPETLALLGLSAGGVQDMDLKRGAGCDECGHTGFRGRTGIFEVLRMSSSLREALSNASLGAITGVGVDENLVGGDLRANGLRKAAEGITTLEEILRVTYVEHDQSPSCHSCRREIDPSFVICPWCEVELAGHRCIHCSKEVHSGWKSCPWCRSQLVGNEPPSKGAPRILIGTGSRDWTENLKVALATGELEVVSAIEGASVAQRAIELSPDLVILSGTGDELRRHLAELRAAPDTMRTPIVHLRSPGEEVPLSDPVHRVYLVAAVAPAEIAEALTGVMEGHGLDWRSSATVSYLRPAQ